MMLTKMYISFPQIMRQNLLKHVIEKRCNEVETAKCPDCDALLKIPETAVIGEVVNCPECGLELEIKKVNGGETELQQLVIEGEDWGE